MSRKHYVMLARLIRETIAEGYAVQHLAMLLASELARDNPNFNRARFLKACGVDV